MLSALLPNLGAIWTEEEVKRYEAVREAIEKGDPIFASSSGCAARWSNLSTPNIRSST